MVEVGSGKCYLNEGLSVRTSLSFNENGDVETYSDETVCIGRVVHSESVLGAVSFAEDEVTSVWAERVSYPDISIELSMRKKVEHYSPRSGWMGY